MSDIRAILADKGSYVFSISPAASVLDAALLMNEQKVGALVVCEGGRICGIVTERDVLRRVVAQRLDPADTLIEQVMTREVVCCEESTTIEEARTVFRDRKIRHLPVCNQDGYLQGIISIGDLNAFRLSGQETTIHFLQEYLYGRA
jgi:CBS domain-containing protein